MKSFYTSGHLFDVLTLFGELDEKLVENRKYAKWKAAYIHNCLKTGEVPVPGPVGDGDEPTAFDDDGTSSLLPLFLFEDLRDCYFYSLEFGGPSVPPPPPPTRVTSDAQFPGNKAPSPTPLPGSRMPPPEQNPSASGQFHSFIPSLPSLIFDIVIRFQLPRSRRWPELRCRLRTAQRRRNSANTQPVLWSTKTSPPLSTTSRKP